MTVQPGEYYTAEGYIEDEPQVYEGGAAKIQPVPVYSLTEDSAPEYGACMTWQIPQVGVGQPVQILTRRTRRHKAKIIVNNSQIPTDVQVANPAAGASNVLVYTVPAGDVVTLQSLRFQLVTDATVGNRIVTVQIMDGSGNIIAQQQALTAQPASTTCTFSGTVGSTSTPSASGSSFGPLPNMLLSPGWTVRLIESGTVGAGDQFSQITYSLNTINTGITIVFNAVLDRLQGSNPQGFVATSGPMPDWESQQPLYAIAIGGATASVSVWDESYAER